ncbi:hypothetical protein OAG82_03630, partial [Rubripirellula sp.]
MNLFKSAVVCVAIAVMCGCDQGQPMPPTLVPPTPREIIREVNVTGKITDAQTERLAGAGEKGFDLSG